MMAFHECVGCSVGGTGCHEVGNYLGSFSLNDNCRGLLASVICFYIVKSYMMGKTKARNCVESGLFS